MKVFRSDMQRSRVVNNGWMLLVLAVCLGLSRYSKEILRLYQYGTIHPPGMVDITIQTDDGAAIKTQVPKFTDVSDLGVDIFQPAIVVTVYVSFALLFSVLMALLIAPQMPQEAFGSWSRFALIFFACFWGFCSLAGAML